MQRNSFVLIPGAGGMAWYWHRVAPILEQAGHEVIAVDLPAEDDHASLSDYAETVARAMGGRSNTILVAQSLGGFTAPLVCERAAARRTPVRMLIFVNAMIPRPGETAGAWWGNTGSVDARVAAARAGGYSTEFDLQTYFLHDVPQAVLRDSPPQRQQSEAIFGEPCRFEHWPNMSIRVIAGADDRFFPLTFQQRVARERLATDIDIVKGGHLVALSNPGELGERLVQMERESRE